MRVPSLVKIDWEMPVKNPRWPPQNFFFVISTLDRGDFPRIIVIVLFYYLFCPQIVSEIDSESVMDRRISGLYYTNELHQLIYTSFQNELKLIFTSDYAVSNPGWSATYEEGNECIISHLLISKPLWHYIHILYFSKISL